MSPNLHSLFCRAGITTEPSSEDCCENYKGHVCRVLSSVSAQKMSSVLITRSSHNFLAETWPAHCLLSRCPGNASLRSLSYPASWYPSPVLHGNLTCPSRSGEDLSFKSHLPQHCVCTPAPRECLCPLGISVASLILIPELPWTARRVVPGEGIFE